MTHHKQLIVYLFLMRINQCWVFQFLHTFLEIFSCLTSIPCLEFLKRLSCCQEDEKLLTNYFFVYNRARFQVLMHEELLSYVLVL